MALAIRVRERLGGSGLPLGSHGLTFKPVLESAARLSFLKALFGTSTDGVKPHVVETFILSVESHGFLAKHDSAIPISGATRTSAVRRGDIGFGRLARYQEQCKGYVTHGTSAHQYKVAGA